MNDLDVLLTLLEAWDPDTGDLPDEIALAMDEHPELREAFDARFASVALPEERVPDRLGERVLPEPPTFRMMPALQGLALAAASFLVVSLAALEVFTPGPSTPQLVDAPKEVPRSRGSSPYSSPRRPEPPPAPEVAIAPREGVLFEPDLPPAPRRLPLRPTRYTQPPPGGLMQFEAVSALRRRDCATAIRRVAAAMELSIDHAGLYRGVWLCFNEAHQRKLEQAESESWVDFAYQLEHFEGTPEQMRQAAESDERDVPYWYREAAGGVELRLDRFEADEQMVDVLTDLFGEPTLADHLARDVHMEALAAFGLSRVPPAERTPALIDSWARRVFYTAWTLQGRPGRFLQAHRKELVPVLEGLLDEATAPPEGEGWEVPAEVLRARAVGEGSAAAPG